MADTQVTIVDSTGVDASKTEMQGYLAGCAEFAAQAQQYATQSAVQADRYPLRKYDTSVTVRTMDVFQSGSDVISSDGGTGGSWDLGGGGSLQLSAGYSDAASIVLKSFAYSGGTLEGVKANCLRAKVDNGTDDVTIGSFTVKLQDSAGNTLWTGVPKEVATEGADQFYFQLSQIPAAGVQADRLRIDIQAECASGETANIDIEIGDAEFFNDHSDQLTESEVLLSSGNVVEKTSSYAVTAGQIGQKHLLTQTSSSIVVTLNTVGVDMVMEWIDNTSSSGDVDFVAGTATVVASNGTITSLSNNGKHYRAQYVHSKTTWYLDID